MKLRYLIQTKINLSFWFVLFSWSTIHAQVLLDSTMLLSSSGQISKVVAKPLGNDRMIVSWQEESDTSQTVCVQIFSTSGLALTQRDTVAQNNHSFQKMDFDLATGADGKSILAWSQWDPILLRYIVRAQAFSSLGDSIAGFQLGMANYRFVRASMNSKGETAIAWPIIVNGNKRAVVQLLSPGFNLSGPSRDTFFDVTLSPHTNFLHLTDSSHYTLAYLNDFYWSYSGHIRRFNAQGNILGVTPDDIYDGGPMEAMDYSFRYSRSILTYSMDEDVYQHSFGKGSHLMVIHPITEEQNHITLDANPSDVMQLDQDTQGNVFVAWLTNTGEIKSQFFTSSMQASGEPFLVGKASASTSLDVWLADRHQAFLVHAGKSKTSGMNTITLERLWFPSRSEWDEAYLESEKYEFNEGKRLKKILSTQEGYLAFSRTYNPVKDQSNVFLHRTGKDLKATQSPQILASANATQAIDFDVDRDNDGNYYMVRTEFDYHNLGASNRIFLNKYASNGTLLIQDSVVNEPYNWGSSNPDKSPMIATNKNGDVVIAWASFEGLKGRIYRNGIASDVIKLGGCCLSGTNWNESVLSMNDSGKFVLAYRSGYYGLNLMIFDRDGNLVNSITKEVLSSDYSRYNMALTNQDKIIVTWTIYDGMEMADKVFSQLLDGSGNPLQQPYVLQRGIDNSRRPALSVNDLGEYCIVYRLLYPTGEFRMMEFLPDGLPRGTHSRVNAYVTVNDPIVKYGSDRDILVSWFNDFSYQYNSQKLAFKYFPKGGSTDAGNPVYVVNEFTLEQGDTLQIKDRLITEAIQFSELYQTLDGRDSVVTWVVKIIPPVPPSKPIGLTIATVEGGIELTWNANQEPDLKQYRVYRNTSDDAATAIFLKTTSDAHTQDLGPSDYYYWVEAEDDNGNRSEKSDYAHLNILALEDPNSVVTIYPNPTGNRLYFVNIPQNVPARITLVDALGRSYNLHPEAGNSFVTIGHLPNGLYHLNISYGNRFAQFKVLKN